MSKSSQTLSFPPSAALLLKFWLLYISAIWRKTLNVGKYEQMRNIPVLNLLHPQAFCHHGCAEIVESVMQYPETDKRHSKWSATDVKKYAVNCHLGSMNLSNTCLVHWWNRKVSSHHLPNLISKTNDPQLSQKDKLIDTWQASNHTSGCLAADSSTA